MRKSLLALTAAACLAGAAQAAAGPRDLFTFEFFAAGPDRHIGTNLNTRHTDFRHYSDYYVTDGYLDPDLFTSCRESGARDEDGRPIRRIQCHGLTRRSSVPGR